MNWQSFEHIRNEIRQSRAKMNYPKLEKKYGVNRFYLWHILHDDNYQPPMEVGLKLGMRPLFLVPACAKCGKVHTTARCTEGKQPRRRWVRDENDGHRGGHYE